MSEEREHLQFLSMFFYAVGALAAMLSLIPGLALFLASEVRQPGEPLPFALAEAVGLPTAATLTGLLFATGLTLFILMTRAGMLLRRCERYRFCLAVATAACFFVPVGTLLGMATVTILKRPATRALFDDAAAPGRPRPSASR